MPPSACPLVQQRSKSARAARREALALLPKLAVAGASATLSVGSATLSVKAPRSGQEGGGRQSGDGVGGGEVGGERGDPRRDRRTQRTKSAGPRCSRCCPARRASRARARQPLPSRFSRPWAGVEGLGSSCVPRALRAVGLSFGACQTLRWRCMRRQTWRRRLHKQTGGVRAGPGGAA